jgi:hypothetical protein
MKSSIALILFLLTCFQVLASGPQALDVVLEGGTVYSGNGDEGIDTDVGISGGLDISSDQYPYPAPA